ncbi:MAG: TAXI family TRAP transporter solute-binding subunit [Geminicoccaceae bacterium]|nr:MAG: TAXI family TRAP transporter solute-binding subunit [Geminicoccaceae bacterium]
MVRPNKRSGRTNMRVTMLAVAAGLTAYAATPSAIVPSAAATEFVRIATAGSGGNFYRLGGGVAAILNDEHRDMRASIQATGGTVENLDLLADREVEIAYVTGSVALQAFENTGVFADRPQGRYDGLRAIATVYPNPQWFVVMDPSIQSVRDLQGKRVAVGMQGSNGEAWWRQIMEFLGWTYADIRPEFTMHQAAIDQVRNRQIDALVSPDAPGSATIQEMVNTGFGIVRNLDEDIIEFMASQGLDYAYTLPAGTVPGTDEAIHTFASPVTLSTHAGMSEDLVYRITKSLFEHQDRLIQVHPLANFMTLENAMDGLPYPLHPGAERFYREQGLL